MDRVKLTDEQIDSAFDAFDSKLHEVLFKKGLGTFASKHEILGSMTEEYNEVINAVHTKDNENLQEELLDVAVVAIFGLACLKANTVDW
jgi:phosphoribosyl-ATP pyrophosphohydrolase